MTDPLVTKGTLLEDQCGKAPNTEEQLENERSTKIQSESIKMDVQSETLEMNSSTMNKDQSAVSSNSPNPVEPENRTGEDISCEDRSRGVLFGLQEVLASTNSSSVRNEWDPSSLHLSEMNCAPTVPLNAPNQPLLVRPSSSLRFSNDTPRNKSYSIKPLSSLSLREEYVAGLSHHRGASQLVKRHSRKQQQPDLDLQIRSGSFSASKAEPQQGFQQFLQLAATFFHIPTINATPKVDNSVTSRNHKAKSRFVDNAEASRARTSDVSQSGPHNQTNHVQHQSDATLKNRNMLNKNMLSVTSRGLLSRSSSHNSPNVVSPFEGSQHTSRGAISDRHVKFHKTREPDATSGNVDHFILSSRQKAVTPVQRNGSVSIKHSRPHIEAHNASHSSLASQNCHLTGKLIDFPGELRHSQRLRQSDFRRPRESIEPIRLPVLAPPPSDCRSAYIEPKCSHQFRGYQRNVSKTQNRQKSKI